MGLGSGLELAQVKALELGPRLGCESVAGWGRSLVLESGTPSALRWVHGWVSKWVLASAKG